MTKLRRDLFVRHERYRTVVRLHSYGVSVPEIARRVGIPQRDVRFILEQDHAG